VDLADVAQELYGLEPGEFTTARNERAKQLKVEDAELATQVKALAKPTTAAWLVNQLVRHHGDEVEQVAQIGAALREAQEDLDSGELMSLNKQRHGVLRAVTQQARALAKQLGHPVSTAIADEVEQTLRAVMIDPDAAAAVRTGTLLKSLSSTGLAPVDLTEAVAVPGQVFESAPGARAGRREAPSEAVGGGGRGGRATGHAAVDASRPTSGRLSAKDELAEKRRQHEREQKERERAERALAEAQRQAEQADAEAGSADDAVDRAQAAVQDLADREQGLVERLHDLEQQVRDAQNQLSAVQRESRTAERERDRARRESEVAHRAADRARQQVERLT
jgi:hypothetical protein